MNSFVYFDQQTSSAFLELDNGSVKFVADTNAYKKGFYTLKS